MSEVRYPRNRDRRRRACGTHCATDREERGSRLHRVRFALRPALADRGRRCHVVPDMCPVLRARLPL